MTYDATRRIVPAAPQLTEYLLVEFTNFMSVVAEKLRISNSRYISFFLGTTFPYNFSPLRFLDIEHSFK